MTNHKTYHAQPFGLTICNGSGFKAGANHSFFPVKRFVNFFIEHERNYRFNSIDKFNKNHLNNIYKLNPNEGEKNMKEKIYLRIVKMITVILIFTCFSFSTQTLTAQQTDDWEDRSDELEFGSDNSVLYIALGAVAAGIAVWYFAFKDSGDDKKEKGKITYGKNNTGKDSTAFVKSDTSSVKKKETVK